MKTAMWLRAAAVALAITALADPACNLQSSSPLAVLVRPSSSEPSNADLAVQIRHELETRSARAIAGSLGTHRADLDLDAPREASAVVLAGIPIDPDILPDRGPVSVITPPRKPNVAVTGVSNPPTAVAGLAVPVRATVAATGMAGTTSTIALEHEGVAIGTVVHRWSSDVETFDARFEHVPPASGIRSFRIVVRPVERELLTNDNHADFRILVEERAFRVLVYEPRPSWASTFVRRALEASPLFDVATLAKPSRGILVRGGSPPPRLSRDALASYEAVLVGAPEELKASELDALTDFTRLRGGTVVYLPDRRPSGAYFTRLTAIAFDRIEEVLLDTPTPLDAVPVQLRASELAVVHGANPGVGTLAALPEQKGALPVVVSWPDGAGTTMFSGALDAWRSRAEQEAFGRFWRSHIADRAAAAPRRMEALLQPGVARPGQTVRVQARLRPSEYARQKPPMTLPVMSARIIRSNGPVEPVRLWPTPEIGAFEGTFVAPDTGQYAVQVEAGDDLTADTVLVSRVDARPASPVDSVMGDAISRATGGVSGSVSDLGALASHLAAIPRPVTSRRMHPARSMWWGLAFAGLLSAEWWLRRRGGVA